MAVTMLTFRAQMLSTSLENAFAKKNELDKSSQADFGIWTDARRKVKDLERSPTWHPMMLHLYAAAAGTTLAMKRVARSVASGSQGEKVDKLTSVHPYKTEDVVEVVVECCIAVEPLDTRLDQETHSPVDPVLAIKVASSAAGEAPLSVSHHRFWQRLMNIAPFECGRAAYTPATVPFRASVHKAGSIYDHEEGKTAMGLDS
ncbi:hypothetical protein EIP91_004114 [Steccherinum ochraceum]|uniref:Uncharacterized protein n=1 Tax=Steccherinum ochraceum TaxID=92696 RepID=A0A4R0RKS3_9APHY|nr:hypothetical protein EIP91_004114 [Steccherinum ochraceum]